MTVEDRLPTPSAVAEPRESLWQRIDRGDLVRTLFVATCTIALAVGLTWPVPSVPLIAVIGIVVGCWPIAVEALADLRHRRMSMELSMLIAIVAAAAIGQWITALVITTFVLAAEILEDLSMDRGRDALTELMSFLPETVHVRTGSEIRTMPLSQVKEGEVIVIRPGERVPVDGTVVAGHSAADQSRITGESLPVELTVGDGVFAGSINQVGAVEVRAEKIGKNSSFGRIITAIEQAQFSEAPVQRLADRLAAWLVYLALAGAVLTYLFTRDLTATISVVVVAGACGVAAGTPLAVLAAIARIARSGAFVKDGAHLEALSTVDTLAFDKTGTLTRGEPSVVEILPAAGVDPNQVLALAAAVETYSEHPLGQAIVTYARSEEVRVESAEHFEYLPGRGVRATVAGKEIVAGQRGLVPGVPDSLPSQPAATAVHVGIDGVYAGSILLADTLREGAREALDQLHRLGLRTMIITGDHEGTARAIAHEVGIETVIAGLLPHEKLAAIDAEQAAGHKLAMIGDGVNDAPALTRARVGIALGSGTDIARESSDVVLISSDLDDLVSTVHTARRARRIIMFNFVGTIVVDLIGMILAALGLLSPVVAAFIHVGSETAFILNSARIIPGRRQH